MVCWTELVFHIFFLRLLWAEHLGEVGYIELRVHLTTNLQQTLKSSLLFIGLWIKWKWNRCFTFSGATAYNINSFIMSLQIYFLICLLNLIPIRPNKMSCFWKCLFFFFLSEKLFIQKTNKKHRENILITEEKLSYVPPRKLSRPQKRRVGGIPRNETFYFWP